MELVLVLEEVELALSDGGGGGGPCGGPPAGLLSASCVSVIDPVPSVSMLSYKVDAWASLTSLGCAAVNSAFVTLPSLSVSILLNISAADGAPFVDPTPATELDDELELLSC